MNEMLTVPHFENEADEANWWFENQDKIARLFDQQAAAGTLRRTNLTDWKKRRAAATIVLDDNDAALARELAEKSGEPFDLYVKRVVHQALLLQKSA